jgi:hypothetical protein
MNNITLYHYLKGIEDIDAIKSIHENHLLNDLNLDNIALSNDSFNIGIIHHSEWDKNHSNNNLQFDLVFFLNSGKQLQKYDGVKLSHVNCRCWNNSTDFVNGFELLKEFIGKFTIENKEFILERYEAFIAPVLPALSILCQGYLAIYSDDPNQLVCQSLDKMGWDNSLLNNAQKAQIENKKREVKATAWWSNVLLKDRGSIILISQIDMEWSALGKAQDKDRDSLDKLINKIINGRESIDSITVAQAYLSIVS